MKELEYDLNFLLLHRFKYSIVHTLLGGLKLAAQPPTLSWNPGSLDLSLKLLYLRHALTDVVLHGSTSDTAASLYRRSQKCWLWLDLLDRDLLTFLDSVALSVHLGRRLLIKLWQLMLVK